MNIKTEELYARHRDYIINEIGFPGLAVQGIIYYIEKENYLKILNRYGLVVLQYLMQYALEVEDYETCYLIHKTVRLHNESEGTTIKLL